MLYSRVKRICRVIWWVVYWRGSFHLKERYFSAQQANRRRGALFTQARFLRIVPGDDVEGLTALAHCFELPPVSDG
jgi:hypothetical protein